ncbi:radical SAM protein [Polyangium jinanense]|uniref:Radical SAM protein n=1 Tax=Polyangium jinanense TaxID=2829994 RepID=A0A9X3X420_9BACT|nr:radical SAM protein [Polyangium jinanense]MDC3955718.1 radical SAM protein [Polyangium jinanense]MDC3982360.1 radical SAM protein [Polyangium jinanense]
MQTAERLLHKTTSLCKVCKDALPARVVATPNGEAWMQKRCPTHGEQEVRLSTSAAWYERTRAIVPKEARPAKIRRPIEHGCPFDCGPCESHTQKVRLPVVTITSACDLDCPICYVHNKNDDAFHMSREEFARVLDHLVEDHGGDLDIVNLTGGEPLLHPHLLEFVSMARARGIHRVSVCSNGVRLARDEDFVKRLADHGARIALSFDTFDKHVDRALQGATLVDLKTRVLSLLDKHQVDTTLIPVMTRGYNDKEVGRIIRMGLELSCVRHLEIHTITYTGQGGVSFDRSGRMSMLEVLESIEETTDGLLRVSDFVPSPSAHPLCYQIAYLLLDDEGGPALPFLRFLDPDTMYDCLADHLYLEPGTRLERALQDAIDMLWARGDEGDERGLHLLDKLVRKLFPKDKRLSPAEALRVSERAAKAVYVHSHMDEETFDVERTYQCCDSNCYADGSTIPVCNYNILYREKEARFMEKPRVWGERAGRRSLPLVQGGT